MLEEKDKLIDKLKSGKTLDALKEVQQRPDSNTEGASASDRSSRKSPTTKDADENTIQEKRKEKDNKENITAGDSSSGKRTVSRTHIVSPQVIIFRMVVTLLRNPRNQFQKGRL